MIHNDSFFRLMQRLQDHDPLAERDVVDRFHPRLYAILNRRWDPAIRSREDPEDVLQSVFRTFFRRAEQGALQPAHWGALWKLLVTITGRNLLNHRYHHMAMRRDVRRQISPPSSASDDPLAGVVDCQPPPEAVALTNDLLTRLIAKLTPRQQKIVEMREYEDTQIAAELGCSRQTVKRERQKIGLKLIDLSTADR